MIFKVCKRGQSIIEYTMLIMVVAAALVAMTVYINRAMNGRLKAAQEELEYYKQN